MGQVDVPLIQHERQPADDVSQPPARQDQRQSLQHSSNGSTRCLHVTTAADGFRYIRTAESMPGRNESHPPHHVAAAADTQHTTIEKNV